MDFLKKVFHSLTCFVSKKDWSNIIIAYEPLWAVGATQAAEIEDIKMSVIGIKSLAPDPNLSVIYGGSVTVSNAQKFLI